jgi:hypothetical protein
MIKKEDEVMKYVAKEGQLVVAGYVGGVEKKTDSLVVVSVSNRTGKNETEWINLTFTNPLEGQGGQKLADLAANYIQKGAFIVAVANEVQKGDYTNYYVVRVELGPKRN